MNEEIVKELVGDAHAIAELEKEWEQLTEDRLALRQIFPSGESKVTAVFFCLSLYLHTLVSYCWLDIVSVKNLTPTISTGFSWENLEVLTTQPTDGGYETIAELTTAANVCSVVLCLPDVKLDRFECYVTNAVCFLGCSAVQLVTTDMECTEDFPH